MSPHRAASTTALAAALALVAVACVPAPPPWTGDSPSGSLDDVTVASDGAVSVRGWAGDRDSAAPIDVVLVAGGTAIGVVTANGDRPDVVATTSREGRFGFATTISAPGVRVGTPLCAVAVNIGPGSNAVIGCKEAAPAAVPAPTPVGPSQPPTTTPGPDPRLDQVQELAGGTGALGCPGSIVAGQTFTAGRAGELEQIDLLVSTSGRARLDVELRATVAGRPDGELLATAIVDTEVDDDPAWVSAVFDDPMLVVDGVQYGFMVRTSDDCDADVQVFGQGPDPYPGGISWISDVDDRSVLIDDEPVDLTFRTYVSVTEG